MRRLGAGLMGSLFVFVAGTAATGAPVAPRTVEFPYVGAGEIRLLDHAQVQTGCTQIGDDNNYGSACFRVQPRYRSIDVEVVDVTGADIGFVVYRGIHDDGFCASTGRPLGVRPGAEVEVILGLTGCAAPSLPVRGVIRVTFRP